MNKNFAANLKIGASLGSSVSRVFGGLKNKIKDQESTLKRLRSEYKLASKGTGEYAGKLDQLQKEIEQTESKLKKLRAASKFNMGTGLQNIGSSFMGDAKRLAAGAGIIVGAAAAVGTAVFATTKGFVDWADDIGDSAEALQMSTQALQTWQFAAATVGVGGEKMTASIAKFSKTISEGSDKTIETLKKLGVNGVRLKKLKLDQQLEVIAEAFKNYKGTDRAAVAMELFGRSGYKIAGILARGKEGLDAFRKAGEETGAVLDDDAAEAAGKAATALDMFGITMIGLRNTIAIEFVPALTRMVDKFSAFVRENGPQIRKWAQDFGAMIETKVVPAIGKLMEKLPGIIKDLSEFATKVWAIASAVKDFLGGWDNLAIALVALNFAPTIAALYSLGAAMWAATGPIGLIVVGIAALAVASVYFYKNLDKIRTWFNNLPQWQQWLIRIGSVIAGPLAIIAQIAVEFDKIKDAINRVMAAAKTVFNWMGTKLDELLAKISAITGGITGAIGSLKGYFGFGEDASAKSQVAPIVKPDSLPSNSTSMNQSNNFNINVNAPGADGRRIADQLRNEFNRKPLFDMDGSLVPG